MSDIPLISFKFLSPIVGKDLEDLEDLEDV
jgi:hypothetical protein